LQPGESEGTSPIFGVAPSVVLKSGAVPSKLSRPECGTVAGIVIPPDVRLAGEALWERELTSDQHRQKNPLTENPSCEAEDMTAPETFTVSSK
jgi:hypothetical protein